jgi:hypothetical protein
MPAQRTPVRDFITKWGIHLHAVGLLLIVFASYHFFLMQFGYGGVPEYRGRMSALGDDFPQGVDYILFNHGAITPISSEYYAYITRMERLGILSGITAWAFFLVGWYTYAKKWNVKTSNSRLLIPALFIPWSDDPFVTKAAKVWFFVLLILMGWFSAREFSPSTETQFIHWVWLCYAITGAVSSAIAYLLHRVFSE